MKCYNRDYSFICLLVIIFRTIRVWLKRDSGQYWPSVYHTMPGESNAVPGQLSESQNSYIDLNIMGHATT